MLYAMRLREAVIAQMKPKAQVDQHAHDRVSGHADVADVAHVAHVADDAEELTTDEAVGPEPTDRLSVGF